MSSSIATKAGAVASFTCIVHCMVLPLLLPLFPILGIVAHNEWIEGTLWLLACCAALWQDYQHTGWVRYWFSIVCLVGTLGVVMHHHGLLHTGFYGVAIGSLWCLLRKKPHHCCTHDH